MTGVFHVTTAHKAHLDRHPGSNTRSQGDELLAHSEEAAGTGVRSRGGGGRRGRVDLALGALAHNGSGSGGDGGVGIARGAGDGRRGKVADARGRRGAGRDAGSAARHGRARHDARGAGAADAADRVDVYGVTLGAGRFVVQVGEGAAEAGVEDGGAAEGEGAVAADGPAAGVDGAGLGRGVELELVVRGYVAGAADGVVELAAGEGEDEGAGATAGDDALEDGLVGRCSVH